MRHIHRTVFMPLELLMAFSKYTGLFWSSMEIEDAICDAIADAMKPRPAAPQPGLDAVVPGYQWKQVFLPDGTVLRASFHGRQYFAVVEGTEIKFGDQSLSPSGFANLQGSGNRNAWKAVWLRFPGYADWVRADTCRAARQAVTARMFEPGAHPSEPAAPGGHAPQQEGTQVGRVPVPRCEGIPFHLWAFEDSEAAREAAIEAEAIYAPVPRAPKAKQASAQPAERGKAARKHGANGKRRRARRDKRKA